MIKQKNKDWLGVVLSSGVFITLALPSPSNVLAIYALAIYSLYHIVSERKFQYQHKFLLLCSLFFFSHLIHYGIDSNLPTLRYELERKLPFLALPLIWLNLPIYSASHYKNNVFLYFSYGMSFIGIFLVGTAFCNFLLTGNGNLFYYHNLVAGFNGSAIYYSLLFSISLLFLLEKNSLESSLLTSAMIVLHSILLLLLSSKIFVFIMVLLYLYYFAQSIQKQLLWIGLSSLILGIGLQFFFNAENIAKRYAALDLSNIFSLKQTPLSPITPFDGFSLRKELWNFGFELSQQNSRTLLIGVGPGDAQDQLNKKIIANNMYTGVKGTTDTGYLNYNFHNQYVQTFLEVGSLGLFLLLLLLIYLMGIGIKYNNKQLFLINVIFLCSFLTESFLSRQIGIVAFVGFNALLLLQSPPKPTAFAKRVFDIVFSLAVIILLLSWLLPPLCLFIIMETKSFPIFQQKRVGQHGKTFTCFKLKTMVDNPQSDYLAAQVNDPRITFLGQYLRKYGLDELPQFFNVLLGDMSVVGPRPLMVQEEEKLNALMPNFSSRLSIKPGITGLAQAYGHKGLIKDKYDVKLRYKLDTLYAQHYNLLTDVKIIIKTFLYLIKQK